MPTPWTNSLRLPCALALLGVAWLDAAAQTPLPAPPVVLTNASQIRALTSEEARKELPVRLRAVVNVVGGDSNKTIFIQDETGGAFINSYSRARSFKPGQFIEVAGKSHAGLFVNGIRSAEIRVLGQRALPPAAPASFDDLLSGRFHYERVEVTGVVRAVSVETNRFTIQLALGTRSLELQVQTLLTAGSPSLVDARVRVTGLAAGYINDKRQLVAPQLVVHSLDDVRVELPAPSDPFAAPTLAVSQLLNFHPEGAAGHRVKVRGVVTHQQRGAALFLRDEGRGLFAETPQIGAVRLGDVVELVGFPAMGKFSAFLEDATFRRVGHEAGPPPVATTVREALRGTSDADLVTIEAQLLEVLRSPAESVLVLRGDDTVFNARLARVPLDLPVGSRLRLTGVCRVEESSLPGIGFRANPRSIELLLRSEEDIVVLTAPSPWTAERLTAIAGGLLVLLVAAFAWAALLRRRVSEQTEVIGKKAEREAVLEERHRMAREMHDTLAQSFSGLGFQLESLAASLPPSDAAARTRLDTAKQMVRHGQEEFRRSLMNLRAQELERGGLAEALGELGHQLTAGTGIAFDLRVRGIARGLGEAVENNLLRIGQECVTNAVRHAKPSRIVAEVIFEPGQIRLRVQDDGVAFDAAQAGHLTNGHFGWRGIRERAEQIKADVKLTSQPGHGTEVVVTVGN
ncbi:MAG: sensor histidine kinase [Pedosphaera sp.]|nr:sensor histidine kinase [Pedosphaera sp.]